MDKKIGIENKCNFINCQKRGIYVIKFDKKIISRHCKDHIIYLIQELKLKKGDVK